MDDEEHYISPYSLSNKDIRTQWDKLIKILKEEKRTTIVTNKDNYIYVEFTSAFFRFVDDVEFQLRENKNDNTYFIAVRSASRLGKSDLGVNRTRIEKIRRLLIER